MPKETNLEIDDTNTLKDADDAKSSARVLAAIEQSKGVFKAWNDLCDQIDAIYAAGQAGARASSLFREFEWSDGELDIFWSSVEVLKPAIYAHMPKPVVAPMFKDNDPVKIKTADILERVGSSLFELSDADDVFAKIRDDLIFTNRGTPWLSLEGSGRDKKVCIEFLDRKDFLHEPARYWHEVGWVARRAWMSLDDMEKRFAKYSGDAYKNAKLTTNHGENRANGADDTTKGSKKASVWEVWHKADNKVYWVAEGVDVLLDSGDPHLKLKCFWPCPQPAYGTLRRRTLEPVPDYTRYAVHFEKINTLTSRIYLLLERVKLKGIISGSGDVRSAIEQLMQADDDEIIISIPSINGDTTSSLVWIPLKDIAETITGLIQARTQLIEDYYQLSGIADIMRGATDPNETLGAQQLKSQYGSVRIRQKAAEVCRLARDVVRIACEIAAEEFPQETIMEMAQMELPTRADIKKKIAGIEKAAEKAVKELEQQAVAAIQQLQQDNPDGIPEEAKAQAQEQFNAQQQEILQKHAKDLMAAQNEVAIEDVMELLRDDRARNFSFEIEDGSTVWADENAEKQSRNEFMAAFNAALQGLAPLAISGPAGADLAGAMLKFQLAPYRAGRELNSLVDAWVDQMKNSPPPGAGEGEEMAQATAKLAEAEMQKAKAQMSKVEADAQLRQAQLMGKMQELQQKAERDRQEAELRIAQMRMDAQERERQFAAQIEKLSAETDLMRAQTAEILNKIGLDVRKQEVEEYKVAAGEQRAAVDTAVKVKQANDPKPQGAR